MSLREIMTKVIKHNERLDYCHTRGDADAKDYRTYEDWLNHLDDSDFLDAYNRVKEVRDNLN